jgi:hypothetical protein
MPLVTIDKRFCGPPNSANGGYACGMLAHAIGCSAEVTLRAPPPLGRLLELTRSADGSVELRDGATLLGTARDAHLELSDIPAASFAEAEDAARRSPYDESNHNLASCFVCGPARATGDGLRIFVGPLAGGPGSDMQVLAGPWVPYPDLAGRDGRVATEFVWSALDCPTGFACMAAHHLGMSGNEPILLGRMTARINECPHPGDRCVLTAWPTGRDGRKLFASSALFGCDGELLAIARATWLLVDRRVQLGQR